MALILAVNPAATQSATLARLARELQDCELIGADSYAIAIKAIEQRAPDLVLLPGTDTLAEAELLRRLKSVPRSVPTLKLPPPAGLDVKALAAEVRALLGGPASAPAPVGTSPYLLAAATAAVNWIRSRRASWEELGVEDTEPVAPQPGVLDIGQPSVPDDTEFIARLREAALDVERERERQRELEAQEPSALELAANAASEFGESVANWLPRLAAVAAILAGIAAAVIYWPATREGSSSMLGRSAAPGTPVERATPPAPAETLQKQSAPAPAPAQATGTDTQVPGWVVVFAPFEITVSDGSDPVSLDDRGTAMLAPGPHKLRFRNQTLGYDEVRTVQIRPTETTTLNLLPKTTLGVTSNEPAEVFVNGTSIGQTPVVKHRLDLGTHTVTVRSSGGEREFTVEATMKPIQLDVDFSKP